MTSRQLDEEAIFHIARDLSNPERRAAYLDQICAGDQALRERVEALLEVHEKEQDFLKSSPEPAPTADQPPISEGPGHQIGRYKLLQKIGEGGFGVVYMAEQQRPVRRKVALKIIKPGMDTHAVVARFEAERQALALMDHPNISRVLDGGATENGRPYFVMELVKGVAITEYCDANNLATEARLRLFMTVCQAVQHAHQKGIIHRDLKPSNILITLADGDPVVKVIDFGVSKALNQQMTEKTLFTAYGQMIGTPQYMSPEQAEMSCLDVDTRSDIYSLGVLLYELLTGTTPLEGERLRTAGYAEMQRIIREEEPPKPSTRLSGFDERLTVIAKRRSVTPERLHRMVIGDLDWIVMKALDKDRGRRYETAVRLSDEIMRYLRDEPVEARPPSTAYRTRKFVERNRGLVVSVAAIGIAVLIGFIATAGALIWAVDEKGKAEDAARRANEEAERSKAYANRLSEMAVELGDAFVYQAAVEAMAGNETAMNIAVDKAIDAGVPNAWRDMLKGLLADHSGDRIQAVSSLEEACEQYPESIAARAMLASAYFNAGNADEHEREIRVLSAVQASDPLDVLFKASVESRLWGIRDAVVDLEQLVERRPSWELARVMLAEAKVHNAWDTGDWRNADEAAEMIQASKTRLPDLLSVHSVELMANLAAGQLGPEDAVEREVWQQNADEAAMELEAKYAKAAFRELAIYHHTRGDVPKAIQMLDDAFKGEERSIADSMRSGMLFGERRYREMAQSPSFSLWAELEIRDDRKEVARICHSYLARHPGVTVRSVWSRTVLCAAGERAKAVADWEQMLDHSDIILWNLKYPMMLFTDRWSLEDALEDAGSSRVRQSLTYFAIATKHLYLDGDRESAKKYFQKCADFRFIDVDYYYWTQAFVDHLEDPNWPRWLHPGSGD